MVKCSIIIPTSNRASQLSLTLASLVKLPNVRDAEVIVIDNGSVDDTSNVCTNYKPLFPHFIYHYDAMPGLLTGRHKGAQLASADILCFLDDDIELSRNWLSGVIRTFAENPSINFVTGPCLPKYEATPPDWCRYFWDSTPFGGRMCTWLSLLDLGVEQREVSADYVWGLNYCIRKKTLFDLGGFHPDCIPADLQQFQGDGETGLSYKANSIGFKALYSPEVLLHHLVPKERLTLAYFEKRAFYQGVCDSYTQLRHEHNLYTRNLVPGPERRSAKKKFRLKKLLAIILKKLNLSEQNHEPDEVRQIKKVLEAKSVEGYTFHQNAFNNSEDVRRWVLKDNYWDYSLPSTKN